jgi:hypothetical protein
MHAPIPHHERKRLAALYQYRLLDTGPARDCDVQERTATSAQVDAAVPRELAERIQADAILRAIVEGLEADTDEPFFAALVQHLAAALGVQYAFVSELHANRTRFRTLAVWGRGTFLPNVDLPLAGHTHEAKH